MPSNLDSKEVEKAIEPNDFVTSFPRREGRMFDGVDAENAMLAKSIIRMRSKCSTPNKLGLFAATSHIGC